jgi:protein TonB
MNAARGKSIALWAICFALAIGMHAAGAMALLARFVDTANAVANAPVVTIDLAPIPVAPDTKSSELPPGPQQDEAKAEPEPVTPVEKLELPPVSQAKPITTAVPPPKPVEKPLEKKVKRLRTSLASAPSTADQKAARAAAPAPGASTRDSALPSWKSLLVATLERNKRYPSEARTRGEQGVAQLAFTIDRHGGVHHARIARSSGSSALDRETLAMLERAAPLPPPPAEIAGAEIPIEVPIRYNIR